MKKCKMRKIGAVLLIMCMIVTVLAGCGNGDEGDVTTEPKVIRIGGTVNDSHPVTITERKFEELFEAATNGAYDVQLYTSCQLGSPVEMLEAVQLGNLEIADSGNMVVAPFTDMLTFMDIPFLFSGSEVAKAFVTSDVAAAIYDRMAADCGIRPYCPIDLGYMTLSNTKKEIHTPADLKGIKFRIQETPMYLKYFETLGGSPTPMALNEVYTACQQGTIDGITTQNAVFYSNSYQDVIKYLSDMNPYYCFAYMYVSESWLETLDDETRATFEECMEEASQYGFGVSTEYIKEVDTALEDLLTVTHLTEEERAEFVKSAEFMKDYHKETYNDEHLDEYLAEIKRIEDSLN